MATNEKSQGFFTITRGMALLLVVVWIACFLLSGVLKDDNSFNLLGVLSFLSWWVGTVLLGLFLLIALVLWANRKFRHTTTA